MECNIKKKPTKIEDMTKEQIRQAITKKRECTVKAQAIVESLLENSVSEEYFRNCLPEINQSHFDDIVEERFIIRLCGYPLCSQQIDYKDIPKQKYKISLKTNKVYDITARKNFCSNPCYKSAMHIKKQLLTSPLWFREYEVIPTFHILPLDSVGMLGEEIDLSTVKEALIKEMKEKEQKQKVSSSNNSASVDKQHTKTTQKLPFKNPLNIVGDVVEKPEQKIDPIIINKPEIDKNIKSTLVKHEQLEKISSSNNNATVDKQPTKTIQKPPIKNPLNIVGDVVEKPEQKIDPIIINKPEIAKNMKSTVVKDKKCKKISLTVVITQEVEKCLAEWFSLDTLLFLFGEEKVKEMVSTKGECIKEYLNNYAKSIFYTSNSYDQYQQLCKRLNMLELEDKKLDSQNIKRESKPLPDYTILKEESKTMQLKVKAFLSGEIEITESITNSKEIDSETVHNENLTQVPLVDKHAQNALRRRIVCQHLNKALPDLLRSLGLLTLSIGSDVRLLVNTFKLKADNIMFKPIQWTLITIIIIKLLSIRDRQLRFLLEQPLAYQHLQLLLLSFKQDSNYLERLVSWLTDVDRLLEVQSYN